MMKVKMLKTTATTGRLMKKDQEYEVPDRLGRMLVADKNAEDLTPPKPPADPAAAAAAKPATTPAAKTKGNSAS